MAAGISGQGVRAGIANDIYTVLLNPYQGSSIPCRFGNYDKLTKPPSDASKKKKTRNNGQEAQWTRRAKRTANNYHCTGQTRQHTRGSVCGGDRWRGVCVWGGGGCRSTVRNLDIHTPHYTSMALSLHPPPPPPSLSFFFVFLFLADRSVFLSY